MELKPCPFCGSQKIGSEVKTDSIGIELPMILCHNCGCRTQRWLSINEAIDAWNLRRRASAALKSAIQSEGGK